MSLGVEVLRRGVGNSALLQIVVGKPCMPLELVGKGVDVVSRLDYTTLLSDSPTVCRGSRQVVTVLFKPSRNPPRSNIR